MKKIKSIRSIVSILICASTLCGSASLNVGAAEDVKNSNGENVLFEDDFEFGVGNTGEMLTGYLMPTEWTKTDLREFYTPLFAGIDKSESSKGNSSLCVEAANTNSFGFLSSAIPMSPDDSTINIEVDVKTTFDYKFNTPKVGIEFYCDDKKLSNKEINVNIVSEEWKHNTIKVDRKWYPSEKFNNIKIRLFTVYNSKNNDKSGGMVYFDDLKIVRTNSDMEWEVAVRCDDSICWYEPGETVTYKPQGDLPEGTVTVSGIVYNSYDEVIYSSEISLNEFLHKGWQYTPEDVGYYEVEFFADTPDGTYKLISRYKKIELYYTIPRRSFVVATPTKPMDERNKMLYASFYEGVNAAKYIPREDIYRMHDVIGFSGLRSWITWEIESFKPTERINPGKGIYYWEEWDEIFGYIRKYGFDVMATTVYTPQWASSYADAEGTVGTTKVASSGIFSYACAPPTNTGYYTNFLECLAERYGDVIDSWEVWNEMNPLSRFWENGTVDDYVELIKASKAKIDEIQPGDEVIMGGLVSGSEDYWRQMLEAGIYDYTDAMVIHGKQINYDAYLDVYEELGLEPKPYYNNEAHYQISNTYGQGMDYTDREDSFRLMLGYLHDIRVGCDMIALFQVTADKDKEELPEMQAAGKRGLSYGLWRGSPFNEPKLCASVMHTFFDVMGKEFEYDSQYILNNGQTIALSFKNNGKPLLIFWNQENDNYAIDKALKNGINENTVIRDWEGKIISKDSLCRKSTIYFVEDFDIGQLSHLEKTDALISLNNRTIEKQTATEVGYANKEPVFDKHTFDVADNINWIDTDWYWRDKDGSRPDGYDARMAVTVDNEALYLLVEVDDSVAALESPNTEGVDTMYNSDSVQFAIDVSGVGYSDRRAEFDFGMRNGVPTLYKRAAADVNGAIPTGWTTAGNELIADNSDIEIADGKIIFKIYLPLTELYPFNLDNSGGEMRLSVVVNECDGVKRQGLLRWSDGIDGGKFVGKYGKIILP